MVDAMLGGALDAVETRTDPVFGLNIPRSIPGVPAEVLDARATWADPAAYDAQARKLAGMFRENFAKFEANVDSSVRNAGPG